MAGKQWDSALLDQMRSQGDAWADSVVREVIAKSGDQGLEDLLAKIVSIQDGVPDDLDSDLKNYFFTQDKPDWVDMDLVAAGEEFYARHGIEIGVILLCSSLPACYADAKGVHVLQLSRQLTRHPERRIIETTRFVLNVMAPGGLSGSGPGILTAKKIRMLHAAMRHVMLLHPQKYLKTEWDADWGTPLNQEDLALTLMTFDTVVLDGLKRLNVGVHPDEEAAYFHAWRYVGYLMGVDAAVLPENAEDGRSLIAAIAARQYAPSAAGRDVTADLVGFLQRIVPGTLFDGIIPGMIRFLAGNEVGDMLAVPQPDWTEGFIAVVRAVHGVEHVFDDHFKMLPGITEYLGRELIKGLESYLRTDGRPMFHVPTALRQRWHLPDHSRAVSPAT